MAGYQVPDDAPFGPLTLRQCREMNAHVLAWCATCRVGRQLNLERLADHPLGGEPIPDLVRRGAFRCRCGALAHAVDATGWTPRGGKTRFGWWNREKARDGARP
jgi:hypothetical protein